MVARAGSLATRACKPRQARKGATVAEDSGAEVSLGRAAANRLQTQGGRDALSRCGSGEIGRTRVPLQTEFGRGCVAVARGDVSLLERVIGQRAELNQG